MAVVLHGGFWHAAYGRGLMADVCADLAANGVAAWNLEYRRVGGGGGWPATFEDVASGIDALAAMPDRYRLASPLERLPLGIPQLVVHGGRDRHVPAEVSERYAEVARAKGDEVDLAVLPEVGHMDLIDPRSPGWAVVREWLS